MIYFDDILKAIEFCDNIKDQYDNVSCKAVIENWNDDGPGICKPPHVQFVVEYIDNDK